MDMPCGRGQHWPFTSAVFPGLLLNLILIGLSQGALAETLRVLVPATVGTIGSAPSGGQVIGEYKAWIALLAQQAWSAPR